MPATTVAQTETQGVTDAPIAERVARLSELSETSPEAAREEAWAWIAELGRRTRRDRGDALAELAELFRAGTPATGVDGPTEGSLVTFTMQPAFDTAIAALTTAWLPWAGKRFDSAAASGDNLLLRSARLPSKLLWPRYATRDAGRHLAAFDFETRVEAGAIDIDREVLVIDYAPIAANPALDHQVDPRRARPDRARREPGQDALAPRRWRAPQPARLLRAEVRSRLSRDERPVEARPADAQVRPRPERRRRLLGQVGERELDRAAG